MSKRTLIIIGIALIAILAAYLSFKNDRDTEPEEPEEEPQPRRRKIKEDAIIPEESQPAAEVTTNNGE
jgi:mannose/fructose/N-acetylgalactosamine-specific phosphotransferase system component IIC